MVEIGSGGGSSYPGALDTDAAVEVNSPSSNKTKANANSVNDIAAALIAIQTELGTDPAGTLATLKAYLQLQHNSNGTHKDTLVAMLAGTQTFTGNKRHNGSNTFQGVVNYDDDIGSTDTYDITLSPPLTAYAKGQVFTFLANTANTGECTLNINGLGAKGIKKEVSNDLDSNDIIAGQIVTLVYDGANFQLLSGLNRTATEHNTNTFIANQKIQKTTPILEIDATNGNAVIRFLAATAAKMLLYYNSTSQYLAIYDDVAGRDLLQVARATGNTVILGSIAVGGGAAIAKVLTGTRVYDPSSIADGVAHAFTVTVTGAVVGDQAIANHPSVGGAWSVSAMVTAANTVTVTMVNHTGSTVDPSSGTATATVFQH